MRLPVAFLEAVPEEGSTIQTDEAITAIFDGEPIGLSVTGGKPSVTGSAVTIVGPFDPGMLTLVLTWPGNAKALTYTVENPETAENPETGESKRRNESFGDPFENGTLQNPNWKWQNEPLDWDIRDEYLYIDSETNRNLWTSDKTHFLYQETDADMFDVETHFFPRWNTDSGVNGLLVKSPKDNNWVTIKFWSRDAGAKGQLQFQTRAAGVPGGPPDVPWHDFGWTELFLRLQKEKDHYTAWYKTDANDDWTYFGEGDFKLTPPRCGSGFMPVLLQVSVS